MTDVLGKEKLESIDPMQFRKVLGHYPTGVCAITAMDSEGNVAGMAVGSFTSVSLDPPLVAFLPDRSSTSWPKIARIGKFCVNVLSDKQLDICKRLASKEANKFEGLEYHLSQNGSPIIKDVVAWIDCDLERVDEAGDHYIVIGAVRDLQIESGSGSLLFSHGQYGGFTPLRSVPV